MEENKIKFEEFNLSEKIKRALKDCGYIEATEIQQKAIPAILEGQDLIGQSKTGTGKTASYSLPMLEKIDPSVKKVQAIILCPTRELAVQVTDEIRKFNKYQEGIKCVTIYGGQAIENQIKSVKAGAQIVIGTPGRVIDHINRKTLKLGNVKIVILDEADEMLNMGFEEDIRTILDEVPENRQTLLFSATMSKRILEIAKKYLNNPKNVKIKAQELTVNNIEQEIITVKSSMKDEATMRLIDAYNPNKAIVFCNTKKKVDDLMEKLKAKGYKVEGLHGDIKQAQRERIMKRVKKGELKILIATDVAARGLDIDGLDLVINYDIPQEEEYYVHRIGRTGRNGNVGKAFTFVVGKEKNKILDIQKYAKIKIKEGKIPTLEEVNIKKNMEIIKQIASIIDNSEYKNEKIFEELSKTYSAESIAKALITMHTNNQIEEEYESNKIVKLFLNLGKKDNIKAKDIVGSFAANTAVSSEDIGKINVLDKFSFVEIPEKYAREILSAMKDKKIKGKEVNIEIANS